MAQVLDWSYAHPRARIRLREGWGLLRKAARRARLPQPFEPPEFAELRRLRDTAEAVTESKGTVLFLSMRGWSTHLVWETTIAHAVQRRGYRCVFATCGGRLPVCDVTTIHSAPPMPCHSCSEYALAAIGAAGFEALRVADLVDLRAATVSARARVGRLRSVTDCARFEYAELPLGQLVRTSVAWFLSRGTLEDDAETLRVYGDFLVSGMILVEAFSALLDAQTPQRIFLLNGLFFAERILCEIAYSRGVPVTRYEKGFLTDSLLLSRWRPGVDDLDVGNDAWQEATSRPLDDEEAATLSAYLDERVRGGRTFDNFWKQRTEDIANIRREIELSDSGRPLVGVFSNILWDSATQDKDTAFTSMREWIGECIRWASYRPDVDLVLRIHPAEVRLANHVSREPMMAHLRQSFVNLPVNVRVVPPESVVSSYVLMQMVDIGLVYTSTVGLEMAAQGIPVVVAAEAHYGRRGFTDDPPSAGEYWHTVERLLTTPLNDAERLTRRELARRYAYLFWFRYHQILDVVHEEGRSRPRVMVANAPALNPGRSAVLDRIVDGILHSEGPIITPNAASPAAIVGR